MRPRTLLVLLALVAGLGAFVWFYERDLPGSEKRAEQAKKVFRGLESKDVTALALEWEGRSVRLEKVEEPEAEGGEEDEGKKDEEAENADADALDGLEPAEPPAHWRMTQPLQTRADATVVDGLLQALLDLEKNRTLEDPDPKALGLDKPQATVRVTTKEGEKVLRLGAKIPTSPTLAAALDGEEEAYVVSDAVLASLRKEPGEWRDRQLVHAGRDDVERIVIRAGRGPVTITRRGEEHWVQAPGLAPDRADRELVDSLLTDLTGLRVQRFVEPAEAPAPAEMGLAPPAAVVEVTEKGRQPLRIELGGPVSVDPAIDVEAAGATALYARAGGQLVEVQTPLIGAVARPAGEWRARTLSRLAVHQVDSARFREAGKPELVLTRSEADWKRGDDLIPFTPVSDLLFTLTDARADRLLGPQEAAALRLGAPQLTVVLKGEAGEETLSFYPGSAAGIPARATGRPALLLLPPATLAQIRQNLQAVRTAKPVSQDEAEAGGDGKAEDN